MSEFCPALETMNLELTTNCPLHCPQCYCALTGGKNIDPEKAKFWIREGARYGVKNVMLSGGETLCYPHLTELLRAARDCGVRPNVALSGVGFTQKVYDELMEAGDPAIYISLNGSTEEINAMTRDGYGPALRALELLRRNGYRETTLNWVMHASNADDFPNVMALAERYEVFRVVIIGLKPDSHKSLSTLPSREQMERTADFARSWRGRTRIFVEACYSPMLALVSETKLFGNLNVGKHKGCPAGRTTVSVNVDGLLSPCRHLEYFEAFDSLEEYFERSAVQRKLRTLEEQVQAPCSGCRFEKNCRHCLAINAKLKGELFLGNEFCPIRQPCGA